VESGIILIEFGSSGLARSITAAVAFPSISEVNKSVVDILYSIELFYLFISVLEEPPPYKYNHKQAQAPYRPILLQQQLPIYPHGCLLILPTILPQPTADLSHPLQAISPIQQILNILCHDLRHVLQLGIQFV
jgi:hypothetical protein